MDILYSTGAYQQQWKQVAVDFARSYWAQPRKIRRWKEGTHTFEMVGGTGRSYAVRLTYPPRERPRYEVVVLQP